VEAELNTDEAVFGNSAKAATEAPSIEKKANLYSLRYATESLFAFVTLLRLAECCHE
jgi:hypothetical protein